ncbi:MAG: YdiU family protein [Myxococcales bacterium]|nr:YdiU family protein [Polyangiaceae bacterium]MDW8250735.1 YdiU family protein [Myxococcales bacterium]
MPLSFDNSYTRLPDRFYVRVRPKAVPQPAWLVVNEPLGELLGLSPEELRSPELLDTLAGNRILPGSEPIALAYAGHQFGGFVPRLGDGRALLLGEVIGKDGKRRDVQLKGSGPTPFSRGGDGRAALGPVLREFLVSEAMHTLGVPTTRALAAVLTGELVYREQPLPGAVLTRVAASHLRIGTVEYFAYQRDREALALLVEHALARHYPERVGAEEPALALLDGVMEAQAALVARWLGLGFVHGVMNTDNCSLSGETLDYGPCAFLDAYDPGRTFSSIDHYGRYAFGNQPRILLWNLARLAEALLPLLDGDDKSKIGTLEARLERFPSLFEQAYGAVLREKLGLLQEQPGDLDLARALLDQMARDRVDYTLAFRRLTRLAESQEDTLSELFSNQELIHTWLTSWRQRLAAEPTSAEERSQRMRRANPAYIPRNHRVEEALAAAAQGDLAPFERLRSVLAHPWDDHPEHVELALPPGEEQWRYRTFCGT